MFALMLVFLQARALMHIINVDTTQSDYACALFFVLTETHNFTHIPSKATQSGTKLSLAMDCVTVHAHKFMNLFRSNMLVYAIIIVLSVYI